MEEQLITKSGQYQVEVKQDQSAQVFVVQIGSQKIDLDVNLVGPNSVAHIFNCFIGQDKDQQNLDVKINHLAPHTVAHYTGKGVMNDQAQGFFKGLINIENQAQDTNSFLEHRTLLLSDQAEIAPEPSLQINANQVKASHAATVHSLKPEDIFALTVRGIAQDDAASMLIESFVEEVVGKMSRSWQTKIKQALK